MYLKQMGQVPLLTREEEVAISKRIEQAELRAQDALFSSALTLEFQNDIIQKLLNREERFDRVVLDKKIESREAISTVCRSCWKTPTSSAIASTRLGTARRNTPHGNESNRKRANTRMKKDEKELCGVLKKYCLKLKIFEDFLKDLYPTYRELKDHYDDLETADKVSVRRRKKVDVQAIEQRLGAIKDEFKIHPRDLLEIIREVRIGMREAPRRRPKWSKRTCASSSPLPKNTPIVAYPSWTLSRRATWA